MITNYVYFGPSSGGDIIDATGAVSYEVLREINLGFMVRKQAHIKPGPHATDELLDESRVLDEYPEISHETKYNLKKTGVQYLTPLQ